MQTQQTERRGTPRNPSSMLTIKEDQAREAQRLLIQAAEQVKQECTLLLAQIREGERYGA